MEETLGVQPPVEETVVLPELNCKYRWGRLMLIQESAGGSLRWWDPHLIPRGGTTNDIIYINWSNGSRGKGERNRRGKEIINMRGVEWAKNIGMRLERGMEVREEFFRFFLVGSGPRTSLLLKGEEMGWNRSRCLVAVHKERFYEVIKLFRSELGVDNF